jgi:hypothetical protein
MEQDTKKRRPKRAQEKNAKGNYEKEDTGEEKEHEEENT